MKRATTIADDMLLLRCGLADIGIETNPSRTVDLPPKLATPEKTDILGSTGGRLREREGVGVRQTMPFVVAKATRNRGIWREGQGERKGESQERGKGRGARYDRSAPLFFTEVSQFGSLRHVPPEN